MPFSLPQILKQSGAFDSEGNQLRPICRNDIQKVLEELRIRDKVGLSSQRVKFDGLTLQGADIRGLDLSWNHLPRFSFQGCDLSGVVACPMVKVCGEEIDFRDSASDYWTGVWERGEHGRLAENRVEVIPTRLNRVWLFGANFDGADFSHTEAKQAVFRLCTAEGAVFHRSDLAGANLSSGSLLRSDFGDANLTYANLHRLRLEQCVLDGIEWGEGKVIRHEIEECWEDAWFIYRSLTSLHESAGLEDVAGEFRYRRERAQTHLLKSRALDGLTRSNGEGKRTWLDGLRSESRQLIGKWIYRRFLDCLFGYGERPYRVILALLFQMILFTSIYFESSGIDLSLAGIGEFLSRVLNAFYFSAVSTTALGYGAWIGQEAGLKVYFGALQSFLGVFLNALFLVTFTRRWIR